MRRRAGARDGLEGIRHGAPDIQHARCARGLPAAALPAVAAAQSAEARQPLARLGLQHRGELHHQHQLAGLLGRVRHELSHADGRARGAELPLGRERHRGGDRAHPWPRAPQRADDRQLLGRPDARDALHAAAAGVHAGAGARLAGSDPELQGLPGRDDAGAGDADPAHGSDRLPGEHQGARHQRWRLLQRQLRASLREPDRALEPARDAGDPG